MRAKEDLGEMFEAENAETLLVFADKRHWANSFEARHYSELSRSTKYTRNGQKLKMVSEAMF